MIAISKLGEATTSGSVGAFAIPFGKMLRPAFYSKPEYKKRKKKK